MPKLKTRQALAKRIRVSKHGKLIIHKAGKSHLLSGKSGHRRRHLRRVTTLIKLIADKYKRELRG